MNKDFMEALKGLAQNRGIATETLVELIEDSLKSASRKSINNSRDIDVKFNPKTHEFECWAHLTVVSEITDQLTEISVEEARRRYPNAKVGDQIDWQEHPENFGRIAAQTAKQVISQRIRQIEKQKVCEAFRDQLDQLLSGVVRKIDHGDTIIDFGSSEGVMRQKERIPGEDYEPGDPITALLVEINAEHPGPSLFVSRTSPDFVLRLFEREVTEIRDGLVEVKGVAREPGYRTKIAVTTNEQRIDPVGACVGIRGSRVKTIVHELGGEKIDIICWDPDIRVFMTNALKPANLYSLTIDEQRKRVQVLVKEDQLSLAIGRRGMNARLASKLTGWSVEIKPTAAKAEAEPENDFAAQVRRAIETLAAIPGIGPEAADILVHNGFGSVEGIKAGEFDDIAQLEGIGPDKAREIIQAVSGLD